MNLATVAINTGNTAHAVVLQMVRAVYQMMFAINTPALITGAFANRLTFKACNCFIVELCFLCISSSNCGEGHPPARRSGIFFEVFT